MRIVDLKWLPALRGLSCKTGRYSSFNTEALVELPKFVKVNSVRHVMQSDAGLTVLRGPYTITIRCCGSSMGKMLQV